MSRIHALDPRPRPGTSTSTTPMRPGRPVRVSQMSSARPTVVPSGLSSPSLTASGVTRSCSGFSRRRNRTRAGARSTGSRSWATTPSTPTCSSHCRRRRWRPAGTRLDRGARDRAGPLLERNAACVGRLAAVDGRAGVAQRAGVGRCTVGTSATVTASRHIASANSGRREGMKRSCHARHGAFTHSDGRAN